MIDVPGDLVSDLPCVQQASYLEGGPLMWMLPLYLHVNQKSDYDYDYDMIVYYNFHKHTYTKTTNFTERHELGHGDTYNLHMHPVQG